MKVVTVPVHLLWRLLLLPFKLVLAVTGLTFRTGVKVGSLPVKGTAATAKVLGPKAVVLFVLGLLTGVVIGRRIAGDLAPTFAAPTPEPRPSGGTSWAAAAGGSSVAGDGTGTGEMAELDAEVAHALGETPGDDALDTAGGA